VRKACLADGEPDRLGEESERRRLSEELETEGLAINYYELAPGDGLPGGLHAHMDQEEVFVVLDGEATFETLDGDVTVTEGELVRFEPGEFQWGTNASDDRLVVLAVGAPRGTEDVRIPVDCPECGHSSLRLDSGERLAFSCPGCGAERVPRACPSCGRRELRVTAGDGARTRVACRSCGAAYDSPPLRSGRG
jgi:uncharacterized cupin superfamily protein